jgi:hypothetical protein
MHHSTRFAFTFLTLCVAALPARAAGRLFVTNGSNSNELNPTTGALIASTPILAADVKHYQCWYRDAAALCAAATFNLTQGLTLTWSP